MPKSRIKIRLYPAANEGLPFTILCKMMGVSRSGFYDFPHRFNNETDGNPKEAALAARIHSIFKEHKSKYGSRRILKQLNEEGYDIGRYKVRRIMKALGLKAKISRRYKVTTDSRHSFPIARLAVPGRYHGSVFSANRGMGYG